MPDLRHKAILAAARATANPQDDPAIVRARRKNLYPWPLELWHARPRLPEPRFPALLTPDGPISSVSKLEKLVEAESPLEAIETVEVDRNDVEIRKVTVYNMSFDEYWKMRDKAEVCLGSETEDRMLVMFREKSRYAWIVKALKEGVTLGDEDEDEDTDKTKDEDTDKTKEKSVPA
ncbi:hypothetical protein BT67DRAFT_441124 [Trichocladium antarcticum]|uniref:Uncharacterized protein n=1 Tax=Trichocladium antarcticum TaxID=1450529 RepID=A0AAN6UM93_9PEZI|nr:hypothetical protein BT67DRAFT_441124 [Trichocladium antarcticum]